MALKQRESQADSEKIRRKKVKQIDSTQDVNSFGNELENLTKSTTVDGKKAKKKVASKTVVVDEVEQPTEPPAKNVKKAKKKARVAEDTETPADHEEGSAEVYADDGKKSKKKKRILDPVQEVNSFVNGDNDLSNLTNGKKAKKKVPSSTLDLALDDGEQLTEPVTKKVKKSKKKALLAEQNETLADNEEGPCTDEVVNSSCNGEYDLYNLTDSSTVNGKKAKKKVSSKELAVDDGEHPTEPPAKKIKKAKKKASIEEGVEIPADYEEVLVEPHTDVGKKSKKKARIQDPPQEVNGADDLDNLINSGTVNGKKAKKKMPVNDLAVDDEEQLTEPVTKKVKKAKKKALVAEQMETPVDNEEVPAEPHMGGGKKSKKKASTPNVADAVVDPFEKYHSPHEAADHWQLRRMFLEQNYDILPEDELECMAQVFMNVELLRCDYPPETMARLAELSGGIAEKYHEQRRYGPHRTLVSATYVAALKAQRKELVIPKKVDDASTEATLHLGGVTEGPDPFVPINRPKNLTEMLRNVIVMNDSFEETQAACRPLIRECGFEFVEQEQRGGFLLNVKAHVGGRNYVIGKAEGAVGGKPLKKQAIADAMNYLYEHCYSLTRKKMPTEMSGLSIIPKTILESVVDGGQNEENKLGESNMGFRLMEKMGWKGGSLGVRGNGIVDPVEATMKAGRQGLGHEAGGEFSIKAVRQELNALRDGTQSQHIVFSKDFTKPERAKIHKMADGMGLKTKSFGSDKKGDRQLVVYALQSSPHQILKKVLVEKDPFYCEMYEANCPTKLTDI